MQRFESIEQAHQDSRTNLPARCGVGEFSVGKPVRSQFFVA
jgi:hypothetical protein